MPSADETSSHVSYEGKDQRTVSYMRTRRGRHLFQLLMSQVSACEPVGPVSVELYAQQKEEEEHTLAPATYEPPCRAQVTQLHMYLVRL